jgi:hypothetical protein
MIELCEATASRRKAILDHQEDNCKERGAGDRQSA